MPRTYPRPVVAIGVAWIIFGFVANEWVIAYILSVERLNPESRLLLGGLNVASILWGIASIRNRRINLIANLNLVLLGSVCVLVLLESTLRAFPRVLGRGFANSVTSKYSTKSDGIYYYDPVVGMNFQLPNHRTLMQYSGRHWIHQTDGLGFRNPVTLDNAEVMLLGDSWIYGHGLSEEQTVGHFLRQYTGLTVANLARQGDSSLQQAYLATEYVPRLRPRYIFYFFFENDLQDLYAYRTDSELQKFIDTPVDQIRYERPMDIESALKRRNEENYAELHSSSLLENASRRLYLARASRWIAFVLRLRLGSGPADELHDDNNEASLAWKYTKHAIRYMNALSRKHQARFVIVPITPDNKNQFAVLEKLASEEAIPFIDSRIIDSRNRSLFLVGDRHFSEEGARAIAKLAAEFLAGFARTN